jgi:MoCo/4Fe-4S cofactor protein with predicted Tat translocation signal
MPPVTHRNTGQAYWRSLEELADTPEFRAFVEAEFPSVAPEMLSGPTRRQFLKLMGASAALAGLAGCRWPQEKIAPYAHGPEGRVLGRPVQYATALDIGGAAQGLLVSSYDGRPIKIEGNPLHPINRGSSDAWAQASLLELYDPDRSRTPRERAGTAAPARTWGEFAAFAQTHFGALRAKGGAGLSVLSEASSSPSFAEIRARFLTAFPQARWYEYEPLSRDNVWLGLQMVFGQRCRPHLHLDQADVIVALDDDFLMQHPAAIKHARDFAAGRQVDAKGRRLDTGGPMNRLYVLESNLSVTGAMADHRHAVRSGEIAILALRLVAELSERSGVPRTEIAGDTGVAPALRAEVVRLADELWAHRGHGVVTAGPHQPAEVHAAVAVANALLQAPGKTVHYTSEPEAERPNHREAIATLAAEIAAGRVGTLLVLGGNPVINVPADLEFGKRLATVGTSLHLSGYRNETSLGCTWHLPRAHDLESWGDAQAYDGTLSVTQPLIEPLYAGKTPIELLALLLEDEPTRGYDIVRRTMQESHNGEDFEAWWRGVLHDGLVKNRAWPAVAVQPSDARAWVQSLRAQAPALEVVFQPDYRLYDGRYANNGWLQELPDPLTKVTWDNPALLAPATAEALGLKTGDVAKLTLNSRSLDIAVFVTPGHAPDSITLRLGSGRTAAGRVGNGVGFDTYALRTTQAMHIATGATLERTGRTYLLAVTQDHHAIHSEVGDRETAKRLGALVREASLDHYCEHPDFAKHVVEPRPLLQLWQEHQYDEGHRWAMAIDLNICTGCSACVVACQAENNIPVVGKDEVDRGREMHWIRVDRYFKGEPAAPEVVHQPLTCHHCENAPCEQVCPVAATVHSHEGLNDMVYNRCIGTRYCSNNCPYKVRRFNWFNNHKDLTDVEKMAYNPSVTVRSRGVMEKCTYCVQRINVVKIAAKNDRRPVRDGEITPACAQACPTQAIVFGDLNDANSRVARAQADSRAYALLEELNVRPRTQYLAKLRNPGGESSASEAGGGGGVT